MESEVKIFELEQRIRILENYVKSLNDILQDHINFDKKMNLSILALIEGKEEES